MGNKSSKKTVTTVLAATLLAASVFGLTACGSSKSNAGASDKKETTAAAKSFEMQDAWIKATDQKMTGIFGKLVNNSDKEMHITSITTDLSDKNELHEMAKQPDGSVKMQEVKDGFKIAAKGSKELKPYADHIMFMNLKDKITVGQEIKFVVHFNDGQKAEVKAQGRTFSGNKESYVVTGPNGTTTTGSSK